MESLRGKRVLVAMGGGIAAFKAVLLVRELGRHGAEVRVAMTESATRFIGPVTIAGLTGQAPALDLWDPRYAGEVHVELATWADAIVVAPATMNLIARAAGGMANDVVLATLACRRCPALFAPAMHSAMWQRTSTQRNVSLLKEDGVRFVGPVHGPLASGESGEGRMVEPEAITDTLTRCFIDQDYAGKHVVISAGPTHEDLDPVRFLGNRSSGKMGFALARAAVQRGAHVVLVAGPTPLKAHPDVERIDVRSANEMHDAILVQRNHERTPDLIVMAAAVADYRPAEPQNEKRKKTPGPLRLELVRNPDILHTLGTQRSGKRPVLVGFALETENLLAAARAKLERKNADFIVANLAKDSFGQESNTATLVSERGDMALGELSKSALAHRILDQALLRLVG